MAVKKFSKLYIYTLKFHYVFKQLATTTFFIPLELTNTFGTVLFHKESESRGEPRVQLLLKLLAIKFILEHAYL